jgi:hypothetical protein
MTRGLVAGIRACGALIFVNVILIYAFGIALMTFLKKVPAVNQDIKAASVSEHMHCERLPNCMWLLLVDGTLLLDGTGVVLTRLIWDDDMSVAIAGFIFMMFIFISALVICNMLIGVLCEVLARVTAEQKNGHDISMLKDSMLQHLEMYDNGDGMLSKEEIKEVMYTPESKALLKDLNVDRSFMLAMQRMFAVASNDGGIPIMGILEMLLASRADNPATVQTIASSLSYMVCKLDELEENMSQQRMREDTLLGESHCSVNTT